jgi:hypothetical protein
MLKAMINEDRNKNPIMQDQYGKEILAKYLLSNELMRKTNWKQSLRNSNSNSTHIGEAHATLTVMESISRIFNTFLNIVSNTHTTKR